MSALAQQLTLFDENALPRDLSTESIKYAGSKKKLIPYIVQLASKCAAKSIHDAFSGSTRVAQAFARSGYTVTASDISAWSRELGVCYLQAGAAGRYQELLAHLNAVKPSASWFTEHYGGEDSGGELKFPWRRHNTMLLDGIREEIDILNLSDTERAVALTSLMLGLDAVDSTIGHFSSYLREWSPRSSNTLRLRMPRIVESQKRHIVVQSDVFDAIRKTQADLTYLDPPYGSNNEKMPPSRVRYAAYYHLWTTVCLNDRPQVFGKVRRREDSRDEVAASVFEDFRRDSSGGFVAVQAIHRLLQECSSPHIILSYSSGGRATASELIEAINDVGRLKNIVETDHKANVMAGMRWTNEWLRDVERPNQEFIFLIEKY